MFKRMRTWGAGLIALSLIVPLLAGCDVGGGGGGAATKPNIIVSSKDFTEENSGRRDVCAAAGAGAAIPVDAQAEPGHDRHRPGRRWSRATSSLYPEYTGTGLHRRAEADPLNDAQEVYRQGQDRVREAVQADLARPGADERHPGAGDDQGRGRQVSA